MNRKYIFISVFLVMMLMLLSSGCTSSSQNIKYDNFKKDFYKSYAIAGNYFEVNSIEEAKKNIQTDGFKQAYNSLKTYLNSINDTVPSEKKDEYQILEEWYLDLESVVNYANNWDNITDGEKNKYFAYTTLISMRCDDINKENPTNKK